ncbi:hypothetical protein [Clostridium sp. YIM B02506]|uniref:hypothetical protein n=1 Tax=Clostridium sp. YIM B02506 TaxID=2910680 RepID=UPI001EEE6830|nr:hypothetical protein [Clostridium sp. YIM B02506]
MFGKKKKSEENKESAIEECERLFDEEIKSDKNEYNEVKKDIEQTRKLYENIKNYYYKKIKSDYRYLVFEKIRLERKLGKYNHKIIEFSVNYFIGIFSAVFALFLQSVNLFDVIKITVFSNDINSILNNMVKMITFFILLFGFMRMFDDKGSKEQQYINVLNNIKLKVIEEIEKEIEEGKKLKEVEIQNQNRNNDLLKEIVIAVGNGFASGILGSGIIGKIFKKK